MASTSQDDINGQQTALCCICETQRMLLELPISMHARQFSMLDCVCLHHQKGG
jgi:hypothetical protein